MAVHANRKANCRKRWVFMVYSFRVRSIITISGSTVQAWSANIPVLLLRSYCGLQAWQVAIARWSWIIISFEFQHVRVAPLPDFGVPIGERKGAPSVVPAGRP